MLRVPRCRLLAAHAPGPLHVCPAHAQPQYLFLQARQAQNPETSAWPRSKSSRCDPSGGSPQAARCCPGTPRRKGTQPPPAHNGGAALVHKPFATPIQRHKPLVAKASWRRHMARGGRRATTRSVMLRHSMRFRYRPMARDWGGGGCKCIILCIALHSCNKCDVGSMIPSVHWTMALCLLLCVIRFVAAVCCYRQGTTL